MVAAQELFITVQVYGFGGHCRRGEGKLGGLWCEMGGELWCEMGGELWCEMGGELRCVMVES